LRKPLACAVLMAGLFLSSGLQVNAAENALPDFAPLPPATAEPKHELPQSPPLPPARSEQAPSTVPNSTVPGSNVPGSTLRLATTPTALCGDIVSGLVIEATVATPIEEGVCGRDDVLRVTALGTTRAIPITGSPRLSCAVAASLARWLGEDVAPAAEAYLGSALESLPAGVSYACRTRNHQPGARLSEHARANAYDIRAFNLADGRSIPVLPIAGEDEWVPEENDDEANSDDGNNGATDDITEVSDETNSPPQHDPQSPEAAFQRTIRAAACGPFMTVLGPGADAFHDDHLHLDMAMRRSKRAYCR
jgi:hypothetical protein